VSYIKFPQSPLQRLAQQAEGVDPAEKLKGQIGKLSAIQSQSLFNDNVVVAKLDSLMQQVPNLIQLYTSNPSQDVYLKLQVLMNKINTLLKTFSDTGMTPNQALYNKYFTALNQMRETISNLSH